MSNLLWYFDTFTLILLATLTDTLILLAGSHMVSRLMSLQALFRTSSRTYIMHHMLQIWSIIYSSVTLCLTKLELEQSNATHVCKRRITEIRERRYYSLEFLASLSRGTSVILSLIESLLSSELYSILLYDLSAAVHWRE